MPQKIHPEITDDAYEFVMMYCDAYTGATHGELVTRALRVYWNKLSPEEKKYILQFRRQSPKPRTLEPDSDSMPIEIDFDSLFPATTRKKRNEKKEQK